jgi:hypothetical protein
MQKQRRGLQRGRTKCSADQSEAKPRLLSDVGINNESLDQLQEQHQACESPMARQLRMTLHAPARGFSCRLATHCGRASEWVSARQSFAKS